MTRPQTRSLTLVTLFHPKSSSHPLATLINGYPGRAHIPSITSTTLAALLASAPLRLVSSAPLPACLPSASASLASPLRRRLHYFSIELCLFYSDLGTIKKKTRGKTTCKKLHATYFNHRREVEFFQGKPIGPSKDYVSDLNQLLGTTVRNPRFVTLLYTSWHGVPKKLKKDMWEYVNQKFILPISSKSWVLQEFCCAWKKYKGEIKKESIS
ncbi:hypothetical protein Ahy_B01g055735 [Arachis hypogaea]|uniref:Uncharacterized protein n=1 Tax=Arachis hypogaea TaxID=3818 RepID=A0A445AX43_ARAHY|nr:hypothetical protein Ahy_B01g055735 [Arachis hypogaea]